MSTSPNHVTVAWSVWRSLRSVRAPQPAGSGGWNHDQLVEPLQRLQIEGPGALPGLADSIGEYLTATDGADPDRLARDEALALWINLYNAGALIIAGEARRAGQDSVLRLPGGFGRPFVTIAGEDLSLDAIEHAKLRRFGDPRVHAALVCGSVSCPTLRPEPYCGADLSAQLDNQMRRLVADGAVMVDRSAGRVGLSRIFLWYGADFVRPDRMPSFLPVGRRQVLTALLPWMEPEEAAWIQANPSRVYFQDYDWGLACTVK